MMAANAASVDECVRWLKHDVLDLLRLKGIVTKLSTNWRQLKLSLREKGILLGDNLTNQWMICRDLPLQLPLLEALKLCLRLIYRDLPLL